MKLRQLITRRRAKWAGLTTTGALVAIIGVSVFFSYTHYWAVPTHERVVIVSAGFGLFTSVERNPPDPDWLGDMFSSGFATASPNTTGWSFEFVNLGENSWAIALPLWMPALLLALPTGYLFWADHRPKPWQCGKCRYDLRGLEGGRDGGGEGGGDKIVCPECGSAKVEG